jgi:putative DNA primase/helicase
LSPAARRDRPWDVVPNLWGGIVARPGYQKSPLIGEVFRPLHALNKAAIEEHKAAMEAYQQELEAWEARKRKAYSKGGDEPFSEPQPERPAGTRYIVNDTTVEKLHTILVDNPQGVLLHRDELAGWLTTLDTKGREHERPFFLETWAGDGSFIFDRIGRGTLYLPHACLSIFGGIQPAKLRNYLAGAVIGASDDDGLMQRFQVLVYPDVNSEWRKVDRLPNMQATEAVERVFHDGAAMSVAEPFQARFSPDAQELFDDWWQELEQRLRSRELASHLESHMAKYRSLMPSVALLLHIAEGSREPEVPLIQAQRAADWCDYFWAHAKRVYSCVAMHEHGGAATLAEKIRKGSLGSEFTVRDVYVRGWSGLRNADEVLAALGPLQEAGWARPAYAGPGPKGGRPSEKYIINPLIYPAKGDNPEGSHE